MTASLTSHCASRQEDVKDVIYMGALRVEISEAEGAGGQVLADCRQGAALEPVVTAGQRTGLTALISHLQVSNDAQDTVNGRA